MELKEFGSQTPSTLMYFSFRGADHRLNWVTNLNEFRLEFRLALQSNGTVVKDFCVTIKKGDQVVHRAIASKEGMAIVPLLTYRELQEGGSTSIHVGDIPAEV